MLLLGPKQNIFELIVNLKCLKQSQSLSIQFKTKNLQNKIQRLYICWEVWFQFTSINSFLDKCVYKTEHVTPFL